MSGESSGQPIPLEPGLEATIEKVIPSEWTLTSFDPRLPAVLSTPAMFGRMEVAAGNAVLSALPKGSITVGTHIEVDHLKAASAGVAVRAGALRGHAGKFLAFDVEAHSGELLIGRGRVYRAIVDMSRFSPGAGASKPE